MNCGDIVKSLSGHDKDCLYVVVGENSRFVMLADGKNKLLSNPKKKNLKHVASIGERVNLEKYNPLYDAHIRKELKGLLKRGG